MDTLAIQHVVALYVFEVYSDFLHDNHIYRKCVASVPGDFYDADSDRIYFWSYFGIFQIVRILFRKLRDIFESNSKKWIKIASNLKVKLTPWSIDCTQMVEHLNANTCVSWACWHSKMLYRIVHIPTISPLLNHLETKKKRKIRKIDQKWRISMIALWYLPPICNFMCFWSDPFVLNEFLHR